MMYRLICHQNITAYFVNTQKVNSFFINDKILGEIPFLSCLANGRFKKNNKLILELETNSSHKKSQ